MENKNFGWLAGFLFIHYLFIYLFLFIFIYFSLFFFIYCIYFVTNNYLFTFFFFFFFFLIIIIIIISKNYHLGGEIKCICPIKGGGQINEGVGIGVGERIVVMEVGEEEGGEIIEMEVRRGWGEVYCMVYPSNGDVLWRYFLFFFNYFIDYIIYIWHFLFFIITPINL